MRSARTILTLLSFFVASVCYSATELPQEDSTIKLFSYCGNSSRCIITESVLFAPIFPWFQYPFDTPATPSQLQKFEKMTATLDFLLLKANEHFSGYRIDSVFFLKWIGLDIIYETYNNGNLDEGFYSTHLIFRPFPRKHIQPKFSIGWQYINADNFSGAGPQISFFNYDINFSRRFAMFIVNYIGWIKGNTIIEGTLGFEYYIYPTISIKTAMDLKHIFFGSLYGIQVGLSAKI